MAYNNAATPTLYRARLFVTNLRRRSGLSSSAAAVVKGPLQYLP